ncbi:aminotransferase class V-fold PLP-dependent enzyme [Deinococcus radiopugnans]|uniref:Aminotransferase class V-fold PLP-dependent enzyme n=1 Tax=Deinococcus radiopugnans ATCC 19172 TaxID=585398 RepID=A0A5C4YC01_9DEIO|nr:aminotransferase class V-fold PLP-dependent enzyme [Deinococcus radiopugnans]MBB6015186.1 selenocysteine lyase/cysteine desulfurase [Deinococcus radiopugnans ATCC 19172]TNM73106.1 aminotransferase class V-fold PLP-dependent enzyme [Deinococcus radiopugnans ATCC 19172]
MSLSPAAFRAHFPGLGTYVHANNCSRGALSLDVEGALGEYLQSWRAGGSPWGEWMGVWEEARAALAQLIGARPDQLALTDSASHALAVALRARSAADGPVVIEEHNFPSAYYLADALRRDGYQVRFTADFPGQTPLERTCAALSGAATLVLAQVSFQTGELLDVARYVEAAQAQDCQVILDGYQALGIVPTDVAALGVEYYLSGTHKYLLGTEGFAFLYAAGGGTPHAPGWMAADDPMVMDLIGRDLSPAARRFESGTPNVAGAYACRASLTLLSQLPAPVRLSQVHACVSVVRRACDHAGLGVVTPREPARHAAMIALRAHDAGTTAPAMLESGLLVSARGPVVRISFHAYNTLDEAGRIAEWVAAHPHHFQQETP